VIYINPFTGSSHKQWILTNWAISFAPVTQSKTLHQLSHCGSLFSAIHWKPHEVVKYLQVSLNSHWQEQFKNLEENLPRKTLCSLYQIVYKWLKNCPSYFTLVMIHVHSSALRSRLLKFFVVCLQWAKHELDHK